MKNFFSSIQGESLVFTNEIYYPDKFQWSIAFSTLG